jgi:hypothetical protein
LPRDVLQSPEDGLGEPSAFDFLRTVVTQVIPALGLFVGRRNLVDNRRRNPRRNETLANLG